MMSESLDGGGGGSTVNPFGSGHNLQLSLNTQDNSAISDHDVSPIGVSTSGPRTMNSQGYTSFPPANKDVPMISDRDGSPQRGGGGVMCSPSAALQPYQLSQIDVQAKIDSLKHWSISTYKCTKQAISEKLGKSHRTVDIEIEQSIEGLRELHKHYQSLLGISKAYTVYFQNMMNLQKQLADTFADMATKETQLKEEFTYNNETQKTIIRNGDELIKALQFFCTSLQTLCDKTIEDTLITIRNFEACRLEYDAYRADLAAMEEAAQGQTGPEAQMKVRDAQQTCEQHRTRYEQLRKDVQVKVQFLDENRTKVMQKQLLLFHNSISAFFSGNQDALSASLKQFSIAPKTPNANSSFLEN